jgi:hypothetical protein
VGVGVLLMCTCTVVQMGVECFPQRVKCWKLGALCAARTFKRWSLLEGGMSLASMERDSHWSHAMDKFLRD